MSKKKSMSQKTYRVALSGMLLALTLVFGYIENLLPSPFPAIPGIKLGLSNGVLLFALYMLDIPTAYMLMVLKVVLSGLLFGNPMAMVYSFAGGFLSLSVMTALSRIKGLLPLVVSIVGGLFHPIGQMIVVKLMMNFPFGAIYMSMLMLSGLGAGFAVGIVVQLVVLLFKYNKALSRFGGKL